MHCTSKDCDLITTMLWLLVDVGELELELMKCGLKYGKKNDSNGESGQTNHTRVIDEGYQMVMKFLISL